MTKQFTFTADSAVIVLNHISRSISSYETHGEAIADIDTENAKQIKYRNDGRIEALQNMREFLTNIFRNCGLEIYELETEELEPQTEYSDVDRAINNPAIKGINEIFAHAFSHFSK